MTRSMGTLERILHLALGVVVLGLYGALPPPWRYLTLLGLLPLGTAITGSCPAHTWVGRGRISPPPSTGGKD